MAESQPRRLSPEQVILESFVYFSASELDEASLVKVCITANCPNEEMAKKVLNNMVENNLLVVTTREDGTKMFSRAKPSPSEQSARLN